MSPGKNDSYFFGYHGGVLTLLHGISYCFKINERLVTVVSVTENCFSPLISGYTKEILIKYESFV